MPDSPAAWRDRLAAAGAAARSLPSARLAAAAIAAGGLVAAAAVAAVALRGAPAPPEISLPRAAPAASAAAGGAGAALEGDPPAYVHAAGAVARPGVYRVRPGGRVADVVDAAGGPLTEADLDQVNLAARVGDGERVYVPRRGEAAPAPGGDGGPGAVGGPGAGPVDLNTATLDQLDALPGVGPATAQAILDHRAEHGRFASVEELLDVRGIGDAKLAALRSRVKV